MRVDVRVIAATNRDLAASIDEGHFRSDLFYRLNVFPIELPPLRERREDIPLLVWHITEQSGVNVGKRSEAIAAPFMDALMHYEWPGNVRELQNVVERAAILSHGRVLQGDEEMSRVGSGEPALGENDEEAPRRPPGEANGRRLQDVELAHILKVLEEHGWKVSGPGGAAEALGLKESTLRFQMKRLGIRRPTGRRSNRGGPRPAPMADPGGGKS